MADLLQITVCFSPAPRVVMRITLSSAVPP